MDKFECKYDKSREILDKFIQAGMTYLDECVGDVPSAQSKFIEKFDQSCGPKQLAILGTQLSVVHEILALAVEIASTQKKTARTGETATDSKKRSNTVFSLTENRTECNKRR